MEKVKVPILLIAFNRLFAVQKVFEQIREYRPYQFFIVADGPRKDSATDDVKCQEVRAWLMKNVDWECELHTLFREENVGCGYGPANAISWFFEHVEKGVILEDDCVPSLQFFDFAQEMLERYKDDDEIMAVNGSNFQEQKWGDGSYYFSMQNGPFCAWATWKRAWKNFDFDLNGYSLRKLKKMISHYNVSKLEEEWWISVYKGLKNGRYGTSSWDYQFIFSIWKNKGKSIIPNVNLTTNIGFGPDATHTTDPDDITGNKPTENIFPITNPTSNQICKQADLYYHNLYYAVHQVKIAWYIRLKRFVKRILRKLKTDIGINDFFKKIHL